MISVAAEVEAMRSFCVLSLVTLAFVVSPSISAKPFCDKQFVVWQVTLPPSTQLSTSEQATIRSQLMGRCFDDPQIGELASRVQETLQSFGYFRATVSAPTRASVDASRHPQLVSLIVDFVQGPRYKVREITWLGVKALSSEQVFSISQIGPDDILDTSKMQEMIETVRRLYAAIGYPEAFIVPQFQVHEDGHWVSLSFNVVEGGQTLVRRDLPL
jgi:outer membrane protein assembly factor BamA